VGLCAPGTRRLVFRAHSDFASVDSPALATRASRGEGEMKAVSECALVPSDRPAGVFALLHIARTSRASLASCGGAVIRSE